MKPSSYKTFAKLLECYILNEDSSAIDIMRDSPNGSEIAKKLHTEYGLSHDQDYSAVDKISWSQLKDNYKGSWVLIKGIKGSGAIRSKRSGDYTVLALSQDDTDVDIIEERHGGRIIEFLKSKIGKIKSWYVGKESGERAQKRDKRTSRQTLAGQIVDKETIVKKFRPLWLRAMTTAEADVKGMIATMIKNSSYDKAKRKMDQASKLMSAMERLETGSLEGSPEFVTSAVNTAILMAASHYYPEETGDINKDYRGYYSALSTGPQKLLKDISEGDITKLGTILAFFKRSLVSG